MQNVRWAVVGPGQIAGRFVQALQGVPGAQLVAVVGRDRTRTQAFADRSAPAAPVTVTVADDLFALCAGRSADGGIDAVYIATPHSLHHVAAQGALDAGCAVLCEKPMTASAALARPLLARSAASGAFLMEAVWTRFLPQYAQVAAWLQADEIGAFRGLQCSFCFALPYDAHARHFDPAQAGGALLDIGLYGLTVAQWARAQFHLPTEPATMDVQGRLAPSGVDTAAHLQLRYADGTAAQITCAFDAHAPNTCVILGERGHVLLHGGFWEATRATLLRRGHDPVETNAPFRINGFEYQIEHVQQCLREGRYESPVMPHAHTLATLALLDEARRRLGVVYPFEVT